MDGHKLYIALRLMNKGSATDVMRYGWPGGMEEDVVRCILCQALQGLKCDQYSRTIRFILNYLFLATSISMVSFIAMLKLQIF
jgi:serine/threonine protein kinase